MRRIASAREIAGPLVPVLDLLIEQRAALFGNTAAVVPVGYEERPFSYLMRVRVHAADAPSAKHLFVKVFKPKADVDPERMRRRVTGDFDRTRAIYDAMARWEHLGVVRPVVCYPDHFAIVTEQFEGDTLLSYLHAHAGWLRRRAAADAPCSIMSAVGQWLRVFQASAATAGEQSIADVRAYIDVRLQRLAEHPSARFDRSDRSRVLDYIDAVGARIDAADLRQVAVHGDFSTGNILISGRRVVVLDFAMANRGAVYHDLSRLFVQLDMLRLKPQFRQSTIDELQRALLRGFSADLTPGNPLFAILVLQHRINHVATLTSLHEPLLARAYSWRVRRAHYRWLESQIGCALRGGGVP